MDAVAYLCPVQLTSSDIESLVLRLGGTWHSIPACSWGAIFAEDATVWIYTPMDLEEYSPEELIAFAATYGISPVCVVNIDFSSRPNSPALGRFVAEQCVKQWDGFINFYD